MSDTRIDEQAIIAKIEALFRQANHPNTGQAEREAFQAKAMAMMQKHRIATVNLAEDDPTPGPHEFGVIKGTYARHLHQIIMAVCACYGCYTFYESSGRAGDPARRIYIFGHRRDADRIASLSTLFMEDAKAQAARLSPPSNKPDDTIRWRASFIAGYAIEISRRYAEAKRLLDQESTTVQTTSNALVLVRKQEQVKAEYDRFRKHLKSPSRSKMQMSGHGYESGKEAARNSNIGRERIGGSPTRALGGGS